jgi:hypothetical protein
MPRVSRVPGEGLSMAIRRTCRCSISGRRLSRTRRTRSLLGRTRRRDRLVPLVGRIVRCRYAYMSVGDVTGENAPSAARYRFTAADHEKSRVARANPLGRQADWVRREIYRRRAGRRLGRDLRVLDDVGPQGPLLLALDHVIDFALAEIMAIEDLRSSMPARRRLALLRVLHAAFLSDASTGTTSGIDRLWQLLNEEATT